MARILIVEDEEDLQLLYRENLSQFGYEVFIAGDGAQALEIVRREDLDLVIMDVNLPGPMDGLEAMFRILSEKHSIPVIIHTAYRQYIDSFMSWPAEDYVVKSGDMSVLRRSVEKALESRRGG
ncbi:MAG: response regulator [Planctomycetes bacterium]|nr:response regulator [Planctomycetota bacterium]